MAVPEFKIVIGPAAVVVIAPLNAKFVPVSAMPPSALLFKAPKVLVPVPAPCVMVEAKIDCVVIFAACARFKLLRKVPDVPKLPLTVMFPLSESRVRLCAPVAPWLKVILPVPDPVSKVRSAAIERGLENEIEASFVAIEPPIVTFPAPVWAKAPERVMLPAAVLVKSPLFTIVSPPELSVVIAAPRITALVVIEIPAAPVVFKAPLNWVVPVPAL